MKNPFHLTFPLVLAVVILGWGLNGCQPVGNEGPARPALPEVTPDYRTEASQIFGLVFPSPIDDPAFNERAQLGRVLFHDRMLSQNGAVSCNSCHIQAHGFAEPKALSEGLRKEFTARNANHLANPGLQSAYFWDGRSDNLTTQVTMPIENHVEMGFRSLEPLVERLGQLEYYPALFEAAFGSSEVTVDRLQQALATFLSTMVTCRSKADESFGAAMNQGFWDPWSVMSDQLALPGLDALELKGFELFHGEAQCANCHGGPHFNGWGLDFADIGLDATPSEDGSSIANTGNFFGGWGPTATKVPSLRNVALTAPYMHDGRFATLDEVLDHYSHGIQDVPTLDFRLRDWGGSPILGGPDILIDIDPVFFPGNSGDAPPVRMNFTPDERAALKAFLHSLTDYAFIQDDRFSNPFTQP